MISKKHQGGDLDPSSTASSTRTWTPNSNPSKPIIIIPGIDPSSIPTNSDHFLASKKQAPIPIRPSTPPPKKKTTSKLFCLSWTKPNQMTLKINKTSSAWSWSPGSPPPWTKIIQTLLSSIPWPNLCNSYKYLPLKLELSAFCLQRTS